MLLLMTLTINLSILDFKLVSAKTETQLKQL